MLGKPPTLDPSMEDGAVAAPLPTPPVVGRVPAAAELPPRPRERAVSAEPPPRLREREPSAPRSRLHNLRNLTESYLKTQLKLSSTATY